MRQRIRKSKLEICKLVWKKRITDGTFCLERGTLVGYEKFFHREFNITAKQESIVYWSEEQKGWRRFMIGNLMEWRAIV